MASAGHIVKTATRLAHALPAAAMLAISLFASADTYPESSYILKGRRLISWNGPERVVDMSDDPALSRVTSLAPYVFAGTGVEEVVLARGVRILPQGAFEGCISLEKVTVGDKLGFIREGAFSKCKSLDSVNLPDGLLYIGDYAFEESGLRTIDLAETSILEYGERAFAGCPLLKTVILGETAPIQLGKDIFRDCPSLEQVSIPEAWTEVPEGMFAYASALRSAHIGGGVTAVADSAFAECPKLAELSFGLGVKSIGADAFANDIALRTIFFPESLRSIGDGAFAGCSSLQRLFFGNGIRSIGNNAFAGCLSLNQIDISTSNPPDGWPGSFAGITLREVVLGVPDGTEDAYYAAPVWQEFNVQSLAAIEDTPYNEDAYHGHGALYSLEGRRIDLPDDADAAQPATLSGYAPPGFYILCLPGAAPKKIIIR